MDNSEHEQFGFIELRVLLKSVKADLKKITKKLIKQESELKLSEDWEHLKQIGDSILAVQNEIKKGMKEHLILNQYTQNEEIIKLNPKCNAPKNAELYFKKASKGKRGYEICRDNVSTTYAEIDSCNRQISYIKACLDLPEDSPEAVKLLEKFAASFDTPKVGSKKQNVSKKSVVPFRHYTVDGFDIYLGKNSTQNDELSTRFAKPWDIWLHVVAHPGSHCIIRMKKNSQYPPPHIIETAAAFSVWFSNAKHTSYAEVHVTEGRYVRKRRKAPPGEVIAERCKCIRVAPISPQAYFKNLDKK